MAEIIYTGSHGTSHALCNRIITDGFSLGSGRAGNGVYFWVKSALYIQLARDWFQFRKRGNAYQETKPECALILADIKTDDKEYIDFEDVKIKDQVYNLGMHHQINMDDESAIENLYNLYILRIEKRLGYKIKMLTVRVAPPGGSNYPLKAIGAPLCCVARTVDCIKIMNHERC